MKPEHMMASIKKYLNRGGLGDLRKARRYLDELIEHETKKDVADVDLLSQFEDALLGCVFDPEGTPVACYDREAVLTQLQHEGMTGDDARDHIELISDGIRVVWVNEPGQKDGPKEPRLRIVH